MKYSKCAALIALCMCWLFATPAFSATDGLYNLTETLSAWDGTAASRLQATTADYDFVYGDEAALTYTLPWPFTFYGQSYSTITADTNGNIWFGYTGSAHSFNLASTGKGPVAALWNNDLSSSLYGGVFVQHKTNPERIVIEWQTETFTEEGENLLNNFEVVLFQNGRIRYDYRTFNTSEFNDYGSGISKDDSVHFLDLSAGYAPVYTMPGRSFFFSDVSLTPQVSLNLYFSGTGSGTVTSSPGGIACNTSCSGFFTPDSQVSLHPAAAEYSFFTGWTNGPCSGTADCLLAMAADTSLTAVFDKDIAHQVNIGGSSTYFSSLQDAYNAIATGSVIKLWAISYSEDLTCNRPIEVTLRGGYDSSYTNITGEPLLRGTFTITDGTVIVDGLSVQ